MVNFFDEPFDFNMSFTSGEIDESDWNWYTNDRRYDDTPTAYGTDRFPGADLLILVSPYSLGNLTGGIDVGGYFYSDWKVGGLDTILIYDMDTRLNYTMTFIHEFIHFMVKKMYTIINPDECSYSLGLGDENCSLEYEIFFYEWIRDTISSWEEWGMEHLSNPNPLQTPTTEPTGE